MTKKRYTLVIVDDFTRYTWVYFLHKKDETPHILIDHIKLLETGSVHKVKTLRSENGIEFKNASMEEFCTLKGIKKTFSAPGTPQQNGVVERKNRTLIEAGRTLLEEAKLPTYFWAEAVSTACYTQNCTLINMNGMTPYQMVKGKNPIVKFFRVFGCKFFILRTHPEQLGKFEVKANEGIFVGYSLTSATFRVYNLRTKTVVEYVHVSFDDYKVNGTGNEEDHELLRFENEDSNSDESANYDNFTNSDEPQNYDSAEDFVQSSGKDTTVEGEQPSESMTGPRNKFFIYRPIRV